MSIEKICTTTSWGSGRIQTNSLRITGGTLRGRRVPVPPRDVRPTAERARQAYFNIINQQIRGARFLDLFAGTGIFSFEAVSRGAAGAVAVDRKTKEIERQAGEWNAAVKTIAGDVLTARIDGEFDLVYADPPYDFDRYDDLLLVIDRIKLAAGALVAIEHRRKQEPFTVKPEHLAFERRAEYGEVWITFFRATWN